MVSNWDPTDNCQRIEIIIKTKVDTVIIIHQNFHQSKPNCLSCTIQSLIRVFISLKYFHMFRVSIRNFNEFYVTEWKEKDVWFSKFDFIKTW